MTKYPEYPGAPPFMAAILRLSAKHPTLSDQAIALRLLQDDEWREQLQHRDDPSLWTS